MRERRRGSIVTIASIHAFVTSRGKFPYAGAKSAVVGITRSLALDEAKYQIRANAVCPGYTRTRMLMRGIESAEDPETAEAEMLAIHPLGRIAEPDATSPTSLRSWPPMKQASSPARRSW